MAHGEGPLSVEAVGLVRSGGIGGPDMAATLRLSDLPSTDADHTRGLAETVLTEQQPPGRQVYDGFEYELTVSRAGAPDRRVVAHDGALTPAQRELIGVLRPHLKPA